MTAAAWFVAGWCVGFLLRRWNRTRIAVVRHPGTGIGDATMALQCALDESSIVRFEPGTYALMLVGLAGFALHRFTPRGRKS